MNHYFCFIHLLLVKILYNFHLSPCLRTAFSRDLLQWRVRLTNNTVQIHIYQQVPMRCIDVLLSFFIVSETTCQPKIRRRWHNIVVRMEERRRRLWKFDLQCFQLRRKLAAEAARKRNETVSTSDLMWKGTQGMKAKWKMFLSAISGTRRHCTCHNDFVLTKTRKSRYPPFFDSASYFTHINKAIPAPTVRRPIPFIHLAKISDYGFAWK